MGQKPADIPEATLRSLYLDERKSQEEIAAILGCSQGAVWRRMRKYGIAARDTSESGIVRNGSHRQDFDGDLCTKAYMLGFCKGDVHPWIRDKNSQTIRLMTATTKSEQILLFEQLFSPYGHIYIGTPDRRGATHMAAYVNMTMAFLLDREDSIPDWVLEDTEPFFAFFAGYVDAEGHIGVHNGYAVFKLDTYDRNIIITSHEILNRHGITGSVPFVCTRQGTQTKQGHLYRQDMWRLQVARKASLLLMFQRIKPYLKHRKRIQDMESAIQNIEYRNQLKLQKFTKETPL